MRCCKPPEPLQGWAPIRLPLPAVRVMFAQCPRWLHVQKGLDVCLEWLVADRARGLQCPTCVTPAEGSKIFAEPSKKLPLEFEV